MRRGLDSGERGRWVVAENWVKYPVVIGEYLKTGALTKEEFLLLSYMLNQCDRETGIIITNSRLLSIEINEDRKRVSNLLSSLKKKGRIRNPSESKTELRQKQGNTKPYGILLCDALPNSNLDRVKTETRQKLDRDKTDGVDRRNLAESPEPAETVDESKSGKILALERDLDLEGDQDTTYPTDSNIVTRPEGDETKAVVSEKGKVGNLENGEAENGNLSYVIHQIQVLFCHGAPITVNSVQYEKAVQISEFDRREIEEALEACEKAKYDLNPTKRPRNSGWILNRLMHPEWFRRGSVGGPGRRTKNGVLAELKEYRKYLEEVVPMAKANPGEQYLKDMVNESRRMIEKLEAEYGRYKTDRGGSEEESGDA